MYKIIRLYIQFFIILYFPLIGYSQTVINTESNLNKIDSTFHLFIDGMGDYKKGNLDFFMIKSNLTIGSRLKNKNLLRLSFSNNYQKLDSQHYKNSISGQLIYNFLYSIKCLARLIPLSTADGSPGPFERKTPSGDKAKTSDISEFAGKTVTSQP